VGVGGDVDVDAATVDVAVEVSGDVDVDVVTVDVVGGDVDVDVVVVGVVGGIGEDVGVGVSGVVPDC